VANSNFALASIVLACALLISDAGHSIVAAAPADDERTSHILRTLNPRHAANVQGLRLTATGTGFFVDQRTVLTNFHVAGGCRALTVGNNTEGEELAAMLLAGDPQDDLAILSVDDPHAKPAQFQTALDRETGTGMAIIGYPEHGLPVLLAELNEVVASPDDLLSDSSRYPFSGAVRHGDSGSPVLDDSGAVLGIVEAKIDTVATFRATGEIVDRIGYAISNATIIAFLRANHIEISSARSSDKLAPDELLQRAHDFVRQIGCWN
jgi:S1-C subfamily serine protease